MINPSLFLPSASVSPALAFISPTTTACAPLSCAAITFVAKSHAPLSISAIFTSSDFPGRVGGRGRVLGGIHARSSDEEWGAEEVRNEENGRRRPESGSEMDGWDGKAAGRWGKVIFSAPSGLFSYKYISCNQSHSFRQLLNLTWITTSPSPPKANHRLNHPCSVKIAARGNSMEYSWT